MRKVTSGLFISLDGVVGDPYLWQFDNFDEDMESKMMEMMEPIDTVLLGRVTYEEWAGFWPNAGSDMEYAAFINNTPKYVASTTLRQFDWQNSHHIEGDPAAFVARLKEQPGGDIGIQGSPTLVRYLLQAGQLDRLTLTIHPVVAGSGKRLFPGGEELTRLRLVDSSTTRTGVVIVTYTRRENE